jgi:hypothetical protein
VTRRGSFGKVAIVVATVAALGVAHAGCSPDSPELFTRPLDAGVEADAEDERLPEVDPTLGGPCTEDTQCDDAIPCTFDRCDQAILRCRNVPDDSLCADDSYCNGRETCVLRLGCAPGPVVTCQDGNPCTIDRCIELTKDCTHAQRDVDGDGDPDYHCVGSRDCDDLDPNVSSQRAEVCDNFKDDNCNGLIDEPGCVAAANDVCGTALAVTAPGTYLLSTVATKKDYAASCTVTTPGAAKDIVMKITAPGAAGDPNVDVELWANAQVASNEVAVALQGTCGQAASELSCAHVEAASSARAVARDVAPGTVIHALVTTQTEGAVDVKVDFRAAAPKPANESCAAPEPVALDTPVTVRVIDAARDLASDCDKAKTGELTYSFTLAQPSDVRIFASTLAGDGAPVVTLRDATCTGELRCRAASSPPLFARNLAAGSHVFTVAGTRQIDASVVVKAYPPTAPPPNQSCATAPPIAANTTLAVDLSAQEDAIKNGCLPGGLAAAYELTLAQPSDVLVIGRFPSNESGAVALNGPACTTADLLPKGCSMGVSPQRVSARNVPAGSYRVVISDELGQTAQLSVLVRPTVAPTSVGASDSCTAPFTLPAAGGFFTGDTTGAVADYDAGCDAPGQPIGGAKDQIMRLDLAAPRRVVMDMSGSFYTTILDVRKGASCAAAAEVPNACFVGFTANKSFLDLTLASGTYWLQVDGYNGDRGPWNLDLRVLPP